MIASGMSGLTSEPRRGQNKKESQCRDALGRTVLDTVGAAQDPKKDRANSINEEEDPSHCSQKDIERCEAIGVVDESDTQSEKNPANNIIADARSKYSDTDRSSEDLKLRKNTAEDRERGNGECSSDEESKGAELHILHGSLVAIFFIQAPGNSNTKTKGQHHTGEADTDSDAPIGLEHARIDFETDEEEEEQETDGGDIAEDGHGLGGEDVLLEAGDAHHHRRTEDDAADDF